MSTKRLTATSTEPPKPNDPVLALAAQHPALTVASLTLTAFVIKVLFVSRLSADVALGLVAATAPADLATGLLVSIFPQVALLGAYYAVIIWLTYRWSGRPGLSIALIAFGLGSIGIASSPLGIVLRQVTLGASSIAVIWWLMRGVDDARESTLRWAGIWVVVFGVFMVTRPDVWLPPENYRVAETSGQTGYFVEDEGEWVTVLEEPSRRLRRFRLDDVARREPCVYPSSQDILATPVWSLLTGSRVLGMEPCSAQEAS